MEDLSKCEDAMLGYITVYRALQAVRQCTTLGSVINGATVEEHDYEYKRRVNKPTELEEWGHTMGALYENLATYTAFAVGGQERYSFTRSYDGCVTTAQLQVVKDGAVVKAWSLHTPLPADELLPYCSPAAYGTAVVDATVRTAMELPSDAFVKLQGGAAVKLGITFRLVGMELAKDGTYTILPQDSVMVFADRVQQAVRDKLVCVDFTMVPIKLNVCGLGEYFKPHVDTPTRKIGTVVVALPSAFEGGTFSVREPSGMTAGSGDGGVAASGGGSSPAAAAAAGGAGAGSAAEEEGAAVCAFNLAPASAGTESIQWAAFLGDCAHEVEPVTAGHCVTVTYAIMAADDTTTATDTKTVSRQTYGRWGKPAAPSVVAPTSSVSALHLTRFVNHAVACPTTTFGILLTQQYTFTSIAPASLKGMDRVVYDALVRAGLRVTLRPVVYSMHVIGPHGGGYGSEGGKGYASNAVYAFDAAVVARLRAATKDGTTEPAAGVPFVRCSADKFGRLRDDEPVGVCLQDTYTFEEGRQPEEDVRLFFAVALMVSK